MNFSVTVEVLSETFFPMNASAVHSLPIPYNITPVRSLSTIIPMYPDTAFVRSHIGILEEKHGHSGEKLWKYNTWQQISQISLIAY